MDATPQETSEGVFQTGPASLNAIKQGHVYLPYDAKFVFAEINADRIYWEAVEDISLDDYTLTKVGEKKWAIGVYLYTKEVGRNTGVDVKGDYKFTEGSPEERLAVENAVQYGTKPDTYQPEDSVVMKDVEFSIETVDKLYIGSDFEVEIPLKNNSGEERHVNLFVNLQMCFYTGVLASRLKSEKLQVTIPPNGSTKGVVKVKAEEYLGKLVDQSCMKIFVLGRVKSTNQILAAQDDFRLRTPDLVVSVSKSQLKVGELFTAKISFKNPLPLTLTNCEFGLEGAGVQSQEMELKHKDIAPHEDVKGEVKLRARKAGKRTLIVDFDSDQLSQVHGEVEVEITK